MSLEEKKPDIVLEDKCAKVWLENGIIHFMYKPGAIVDLEVQKRHIEFRTIIGGGITRPVFSDAREAQYWTREAKQYSLSQPQGVSAIAMLIKDSTVQKVIINSALKFMKLSHPIKAFTDKDKAMEWLEGFK